MLLITYDSFCANLPLINYTFTCPGLIRYYAAILIVLLQVLLICLSICLSRTGF